MVRLVRGAAHVGSRLLLVRAARRTGLPALVTAAVLVVGVLAAPSPASADAGDVGVQSISHAGTGTPTGTKRAESVLWCNDGSWWGNLWDTGSADFHIFRFDSDDRTWVDTGVATETRSNTHPTCCGTGPRCTSRQPPFVNDGVPAGPGSPSTCFRYSYDSGTDKYTLLSPTRSTTTRPRRSRSTRTRRAGCGPRGSRTTDLSEPHRHGRKTWGTPFAAPGAGMCRWTTPRA